MFSIDVCFGSIWTELNSIQPNITEKQIQCVVLIDDSKFEIANTIFPVLLTHTRIISKTKTKEKNTPEK